MARHHVQDTVPTVVLHLVAAGVNVAAGLALGATASATFSAGLVTVALGGPLAGLALSLAGRERSGAALLALSYLGASALGLYSLLGLGVLTAVLHAPPGAGWRLAYFVTAVLLPLLQIKGIWEAGAVWLPPEEESEHRTVT